MDTKQTIFFLQKRKKEKRFTKGVRVFINTFEYDVSKSRARVNKFCEEKEIKEVFEAGIEVKDLAPKYNSSEMIKEYYSKSKTISLTKKEALAEYKRIIKNNGCIALFGSEPFTSTLICSNIKDFKKVNTKNIKYQLDYLKDKFKMTIYILQDD